MSRGFWTGMVAGVVIGTAVGMLIGPEMGKDRRSMLTGYGRRMGKLAKRMMRRGGDVVDMLEEAID